MESLANEHQAMDQDTVRIFVIINFNVFLIVSSILILIGSIKLFFEFRKEVVDYFRIYQLILCSFIFLINILQCIFSLTTIQLALAFAKLADALIVNVISFEALNQLGWFVIIMHLKHYMKMDQNGIDYVKLRKSIKSIEKAGATTYITIYAISMSLGIFVFLVQISESCIVINMGPMEQNSNSVFVQKETAICRAMYIAEDINSTYRLVAFAVIVVSKIVIFRFLLYYLKKNLHFYYTQIRGKVITLTIITIILILIQYFREIPWKLSVRDFVMCYFDRDGYIKITVGDFILTVTIYYTSTVPFLILAYLNISNINFKLYLEVVLKGYKICQFYKDASIYLKVKNSELLLSGTNQNSSRFVDRPIELFDGNGAGSNNSDGSLLSEDYSSIEYVSYKHDFLQLKEAHSKSLWNTTFAKKSTVLENTSESNQVLNKHHTHEI